ncbi:MAG TPA: hypothetical protein VMW46_11360 [Candidatus Desulfaltia sp.]|nr:hypothetical protein [Candidatus Desulfaltia sp.]
MSRCKTVSFFYALIPLRPWRDLLIRRHIEGCPHCQAGLASRGESRSLFVQEGTVSSGRTLWTGIESGLADEAGEPIKTISRQAPSALRRRRWAVAAALLLVLATGYWLLKDYQPEAVSVASAAPARFELEYVRVDGQPANAVIYQPQGSDMIIIWAGKNR